MGIAHQRWEYVCDYYHTGPEQDKDQSIHKVCHKAFQ